MVFYKLHTHSRALNNNVNIIVPINISIIAPNISPRLNRGFIVDYYLILIPLLLHANNILMI